MLSHEYCLEGLYPGTLFSWVSCHELDVAAFACLAYTAKEESGSAIDWGLQPDPRCAALPLEVLRPAPLLSKWTVQLNLLPLSGCCRLCMPHTYSKWRIWQCSWLRVIIWSQTCAVAFPKQANGLRVLPCFWEYYTYSINFSRSIWLLNVTKKTMPKPKLKMIHA